VPIVNNWIFYAYLVLFRKFHCAQFKSNVVVFMLFRHDENDDLQFSSLVYDVDRTSHVVNCTPSWYPAFIKHPAFFWDLALIRDPAFISSFMTSY